MTRRASLNHHQLQQLLKPENELEKKLLSTDAFLRGMDWGEPRFGHPEGKVAVHVREVLDNIDRLKGLGDTERTRLRLISFAHDTFKYLEDRSNPRDWAKHHGVIARDFLQEFTTDPVVLKITAFHDDAYYAWLYEKRHVEHLQHKQLEFFQRRMEDCMQLFYLFFKCDTLTGDKTLAPLTWFEEHVTGIDLVYLERK